MSHFLPNISSSILECQLVHLPLRLSKNAQHALRKTMESFVSTCRMILITHNTSKIIDAIRSRCLHIRVPAPSMEEISSVLIKVGKKEGITLDGAVAAEIAVKSKRNLRQALLTMELMKVHSTFYFRDHHAYPLSLQMRDPSMRSQTIELPDWHLVIRSIALDIVEDQSPQRLLKIREKFYELLGHCIPPDVIIRTLTLEILPKLDAELKTEVISAAAFFEHRITVGTKAIFHLEAFVARVMCLYKRFLINMFDF